jgi:hypothetical protein
MPRVRRRLAWFALEEKVGEQQEFDRHLQGVAGLSTDFEAGIAAFKEKCALRFGGAR